MVPLMLRAWPEPLLQGVVTVNLGDKGLGGAVVGGTGRHPQTC
jgi:hypothetical protein